MPDELDRIIRDGNRFHDYTRSTDNWLHCADGFTVSVLAGIGAYCTPHWIDAKPGTDPEGPFTHVEVGFPSERPEPWDQWSEYAETPEEPTDTVYGQVPAGLVRALVDAHGGVTRAARRSMALHRWRLAVLSAASSSGSGGDDD